MHSGKKDSAAEKIRFYLDENLPVAIATQLVSRGIDVLTVRDLSLLGEDDVDQLQVATELGRVLCTYDSDFIGLAKSGVEHAGIVVAKQKRDHIGAIVE